MGFMDSAKSKAKDVASDLADKAEDLVDKVEDAAEPAWEKVKDVAGDLGWNVRTLPLADGRVAAVDDRGIRLLDVG